MNKEEFKTFASLLFKSDMQTITLHEAGHAICNLAFGASAYVDIQIGRRGKRGKKYVAQVVLPVGSYGSNMDDASFRFAGAIAECLAEKPNARDSTLYKAVNARLHETICRSDFAFIEEASTRYGSDEALKSTFQKMAFQGALFALRANWQHVLTLKDSLMARFDAGETYVEMRVSFEEYLSWKTAAKEAAKPLLV